MKNNEENQNSRMSNQMNDGTRVFRKQNIDDTVVNFHDIHDNRSDDFRLLPEEDMDSYVPGLDDIDHFDFDDSDVERYRKLNEEEARKRAARKKKLEERRAGGTEAVKGQGRSKKTGNGQAENKKGRKSSRKKLFGKQKAASGNQDDPNVTVYSLTEKRRTNKEIMRVTYVMMLLFFGMIGYFIYFDAVGSKDVINNAHNSRLAKMAEKVVRGDILSSDGEILAQSVSDGNGNYTRVYPYGCTFAHVVGTSDINKSGIELSSDFSLISSDIQPLEKIFNEIRGEKNPGNNVITTLDADLQQVAHDALGDREGAIIAIEPSTGKVLAMISKPDYDPNTLVDDYEGIINDEDSKVLLNQSTQGLFVPGSIFKIVTTLAWMRNGGSLDDYSYDCTGSIYLKSDDGDSYINCYDGEVHGELDLTESFAESCNASFANLGLSIPVDKMNEVCNALLFNTSLPTDFTTSKSQFNLSENDSEWQIGATAIGHGSTVLTPMHAAMLTSAIANGGTLMEPYVIDEVQSASGNVVDKNMPVSYGSLMTASEAGRLTEMMKAVVDEGTAWRLADKSYDAAGKTGTAEVAGRGNNAWFVGFAPADNPQIAVCILVEDAGTASSETVPIAGELFDAYLNK